MLRFNPTGVVAGLILAGAVLAADPPTDVTTQPTALRTAMAAGPAVRFVAKPSLKKEGTTLTVSFAVSAPTDVEVAILDANGAIVRHLATEHVYVLVDEGRADRRCARTADADVDLAA